MLCKEKQAGNPDLEVSGTDGSTTSFLEKFWSLFLYISCHTGKSPNERVESCAARRQAVLVKDPHYD
jgi:hypothetical protein